MSNYKRILIAIDFSDLTDTIIHRLQTIEKDNTTRICCLHVIDKHIPKLLGESETDAMYYAEGWESNELKSKSNAKSALEELISKNSIKNTECIVETGTPRRTPRHCILSIAKSLDIDLIVIGSHGVHGWKKLLGATAEHVLHNAKCDVLSIRAQEKQN